MKIKHTKSNHSLGQLTAREVDELINASIIRRLIEPKKEKDKEKKDTNAPGNSNLPDGPIGFRKARKNDPL
jgi:hypothetical protein